VKGFGVYWILAVALSAAAAPFQNLGFDEANTNGVAAGTFGPASQLLPGWRLFDQLGEKSPIGYNANAFGGNQVVLYDRSYLDFGAPVPGDGYALGLWPGPGLEVTEGNSPYHLSQIGEVPSDAQTIHFVNFGSSFDLHINGQDVPLIYDYPPDYLPPLFNRGIPVPAVGDISAFAGRTVELEFITSLTPVRPGDQLYGIDSISFSQELIPEPGTWALIGFGSAALLFWARIRKHQMAA
jgi:hypothetical protein